MLFASKSNSFSLFLNQIKKCVNVTHMHSVAGQSYQFLLKCPSILWLDIMLQQTEDMLWYYDTVGLKANLYSSCLTAEGPVHQLIYSAVMLLFLRYVRDVICIVTVSVDNQSLALELYIICELLSYRR